MVHTAGNKPSENLVGIDYSRIYQSRSACSEMCLAFKQQVSREPAIVGFSNPFPTNARSANWRKVRTRRLPQFIIMFSSQSTANIPGFVYVLVHSLSNSPFILLSSSQLALNQQIMKFYGKGIQRLVIQCDPMTLCDWPTDTRSSVNFQRLLFHIVWLLINCPLRKLSQKQYLLLNFTGKDKDKVSKYSRAFKAKNVLAASVFAGCLSII
jgi:hypothetical protein